MILISQSDDEKIVLAIQGLRFRLLTWALVLFTWTGKGRFWVFVAFTINIVNRYSLVFNPYLAKAFYAPLLVWMISGVIKRTVKRKRPPSANRAIIPLVKQDGFSFPSSHAGSTFAFAFILLWWGFPEAKWFALWASVVSFSRIYLGVHYLTDVIAGIFVGLTAAAIAFLML